MAAYAVQYIKGWFRRATADPRSSTLSSEWAKTLKELRKPADGPPKKLASWQLVMHRESERINEQFAEEKALPENENKADIAIRTGIAKRLLDKAGEEAKVAIADAVQADFAEKVALRQRVEEGGAADPVVQDK